MIIAEDDDDEEEDENDDDFTGRQDVTDESQITVNPCRDGPVLTGLLYQFYYAFYSNRVLSCPLLFTPQFITTVLHHMRMRNPGMLSP
jgi:hypothetical protein